MSIRRVRPVWSHLARLFVFALAALAFSSAPARPVHASPLPLLPGAGHAAARPLLSGQLLRWNTFLGASGTDYANAIATDATGNLYVTGSSEATWQGETLPVRAFTGGDDAFVAKLNSHGTLLWNTFLGGSAFDTGNGITLDASGDVFVMGISASTWEGTSPPRRAHSGGGSYDAFVAKLNPNGELIWNTFLGGSGADQGFGIAVAGDGNIYVAGNGSDTWQGTSTPVRAHSAGWDAFAAKLDSSGTLLWNTFLGGDGNDDGTAVAVYGNDNIYVVGNSGATWQGSSSPLRSYAGLDDGYVAKLGANGDLIWNTFLGGGDYDYGNGIAVNGDGSVYAVGLSYAGWQGASQAVRPYSGADDAFVAKLSPAGSLTWNTFLGGSGYDAGTAIVVGANTHIAGHSNATWGSPARSYSGGGDAFAAELTLDGSLTWSTFLGGSGTDSAYAVAQDGNGNVYVAGNSNATWGSPLHPYASGGDAFLAQIGGMYLNLPLISK